MIETSNYKGSVGETFFVSEATFRGYNINVPVSPQPYDYILCNNTNQVFKIQVKANFERDKIKDIDKYHNSVDIIAVYIDNLRKFYLFPIVFLKQNKHLQIRNPGKSTNKFHQYLDNWTIFDAQQIHETDFAI